MSCSNQRKKGMDSQWVALFSDDHSRVVLQQIPGRPKSSDYINANFIDVSLFSQMQSSPSFIAQQVFAAKVDWIKLYTFQSMLNYLNTCSNLFKHLKFSIFFILWNIFFFKENYKIRLLFFLVSRVTRDTMPTLPHKGLYLTRLQTSGVWSGNRIP